MSIYDMIRKQGQMAEQSKSGSVGRKLRENGEDVEHIVRDATKHQPMCNHCRELPATERKGGRLTYCKACAIELAIAEQYRQAQSEIDRT